ncbi:MAG: M56 family metallopeptidase, partial [Bacteroidota bacterium]
HAIGISSAWGLGRAAIVLPRSADEWDDNRREAVLLHEMAHLRRGDARTQLVAQVAVALHWFDPLAWWAYRRFLVEREHACDDAVLRTGARPSAYATHLVDIARRAKRERMVLAAVSPMAREAGLEGRVRSILADRRRGAPSRAWTIAMSATAVAVLLPLAACTLTSPRAPKAPEPAPVASPAPPPAPLAPEPPRAPEAPAAPAAIDARLDLDEILAPDLESALAEVRALQASDDWADVDWAEIEIEIESAIADARIDWDETLAQVHEELAEMDFAEWSPEARAEHARAMANLRSELASLGQEDAKAARREAEIERRRAVEEAVEERQEALREGRDAIREAQHEARREAERAREEKRRERERATRQRGESGSFSFSFTTRGRSATASAGMGASAWAQSVSAWETGVESIAESVAHVSADHIGDLKLAIDGMADGLEDMERSGDAWARSSAEKRIVSERLDRSRRLLAHARRVVDDAVCTD